MKAVLHYEPGPVVKLLFGGMRADGIEVAVVGAPDTEAFAREIADADMLLHVLTRVTADMMAGAPNLKLIQKIGVGVDTIDLDAARARGIAVCNMPGTNTAAVAELTLGLMLACLRRLPALHRATIAGLGWEHQAVMLDGVKELGDCVVGLVGYGAIPRRLAPVLSALGARVIAYNRSGVTDDFAEARTLDALLREADIVSLHLPLNDGTRHILDQTRLSHVRHGTVIINTARGGLIEEAALIDALRSGRIGMAGLDVFAQEPIDPNNPLLSLPNVVVTPHIAWMTEGTWRRSVDVIVANARRLAAGEPLLHRVA